MTHFTWIKILKHESDILRLPLKMGCTSKSHGLSSIWGWVKTSYYNILNEILYICWGIKWNKHPPHPPDAANCNHWTVLNWHIFKLLWEGQRNRLVPHRIGILQALTGNSTESSLQWLCPNIGCPQIQGFIMVHHHFSTTIGEFHCHKLGDSPSIP